MCQRRHNEGDYRKLSDEGKWRHNIPKFIGWIKAVLSLREMYSYQCVHYKRIKISKQ